MIQGTYAISLPSFVVLGAALYQKETRNLPGVLTLASGIALWFYEIARNVGADGSGEEVLSPGFPAILLVLSFLIYWISDWVVKFYEARGRTT